MHVVTENELVTLVSGSEFPDLHTSVSLIRRGHRRILVDTGHDTDADDLLGALDSHQIDPAEVDTVVLTHFHIDHVANLGLFDPELIYMGAADLETTEQLTTSMQDPQRLAEILAESSGVVAASAVAALVRMFQAHAATIAGLVGFRDRVQPITAGVKIIPGVTVLPAPGHTRGQLVVWHEAEVSTCLASDALPSRAVLEPGASIERYFNHDDAAFRAVIRGILRRADRVVPGHDTSFTVHDVTTRNGVRND